MSMEHVNRNYKDTVFRMVFKEKRELLELYNGINNKNYTNSEDLEITTLENAIYMGMKNDVSCCVDMNLQLYEQQSTINPNMPLRFLIYFGKQVDKLMINHDVYSRKKVILPIPRFYVFYNGEEEQPEYKEMRLSDSYTKKAEEYALDVCVRQFNINPGYNEKLKKKCPTLMQYMQYVTKVRTYHKSMSLAEAVELAVDECIKENILRDFLLKNKAEVISMSIFEYDEEKHLKNLYKEAKEEGWEDGHAEGLREQTIIIATNLKKQGINDTMIAEATGLSLEEVLNLVK